jgi:putative tryptophan/tyrosine transport system substrate-binding protein
MKRREFIAGLGVMAWPLLARAARPRVALLTLQGPQDVAHRVASFVDGLRDFGYIEKQTVDIDYRYAGGDIQPLNSLAKELIALKPDVAFGGEPSAARALKAVAPNLPIVCPTITDVLLRELGASYARPAGSVTGIAISVEGVTDKLLELASEIIPGIVRVGFLANPNGASMSLFAQRIGESAKIRGVTVIIEEARTPDDLGIAIDRLANQQVQAIIIPSNALFLIEDKRLAQLALAVRLPTIFSQREDVEVGGLASYGVDQHETWNRAAGYVDRILKGAKPNDLPIEFPTKLQLAANIRTAKALGITIPATVIARADEVIE